ncbi:MAG: hypothetical protein WBW61_13300, partial [Rhodanobacteraceae bacterium]
QLLAESAPGRALSAVTHGNIPPAAERQEVPWVRATVGGVAHEDAHIEPHARRDGEPVADIRDAQTRGLERKFVGPSMWHTFVLFVASAALIAVLILLTPP